MTSRVHTVWWRSLGALALLLGMAAVVGAAIGHAWMLIALASLGALAWQQWKLRGLLSQLLSRRRIEPPRRAGAWSEVDALLPRSQVEMRAHKRRLLDMLRAYRAAAAALPDGVVVLERNSQRVVWFNESATRLLGLRYHRMSTHRW